MEQSQLYKHTKMYFESDLAKIRVKKIDNYKNVMFIELLFYNIIVYMCYIHLYNISRMPDFAYLATN